MNAHVNAASTFHSICLGL